MSTYLITGGAGFIGSHIVEQLVSNGEKVRVLDNLSTGKIDNIKPFESSIDFIEGDILDEKILFDAVKDVDFICHNAALPSVARSVEDPLPTNDINIRGTLNVLMAAKKNKVKRVVFASSSSVYGNTEVLPKVETMSPQPLSPYAVSKITGEYYLNNFWVNYGLKTVSLRYFNVFGPRQNPKSDYAAVIPSFISNIISKKAPTIYGDGLQTRDFTYVGNVVEANLKACTEELSEYGVAINVCTGGRISINDIFNLIAKITGSNIKAEYGQQRAGDVRDSQGDITRINNILKINEMISLEEGLEKTIDWYTKNT
ncbi:MAG: SDR family oxidoreductase [Candidatus Aureabacteria bacterium]|nr:SDR family oxidoreductase [Candidatus Auribacterota bacterium]